MKTVNCLIFNDLQDYCNGINNYQQSNQHVSNYQLIGDNQKMKAITELQFDGKHIEEIEKVIAIARSQQPGNADPDLSPAAFDATRNRLNAVT